MSHTLHLAILAALIAGAMSLDYQIANNDQFEQEDYEFTQSELIEGDFSGNYHDGDCMTDSECEGVADINPLVFTQQND